MAKFEHSYTVVGNDIAVETVLASSAPGAVFSRTVDYTMADGSVKTSTDVAYYSPDKPVVAVLPNSSPPGAPFSINMA